jgi:adenylate kinase
MKNIMFIAPPAAGKGNQAELVNKKYKLPHISTGDILREI